MEKEVGRKVNGLGGKERRGSGKEGAGMGMRGRKGVERRGSAKFVYYYLSW